MTDEAGEVVGRVLYDPYGNIISNTIPLTLTDYLYTGQRWDENIGLYDYNARFYDPLTGGFTQPDTFFGGAAGSNRYGYVGGNPVNYRDPTGHCIDGISTAVCVAVGTATVAGLLNVGIGGASAYLSNEDYTLQDGALDFGIGFAFGLTGYGVGARFASPLLRIPSYGILSLGEGMTSSYAHNKTFTTNDALWAFSTGVAFGAAGDAVGKFVNKNIGKFNNHMMTKTQTSIRAMRSANWEDAARIAQYRREFPNSKLIRGLGNYHMSKYMQWNNDLYHPLSKIGGAPVETIIAVTGAFLTDSEFLNLFPTPPFVSNPPVLIQGR